MIAVILKRTYIKQINDKLEVIKNEENLEEKLRILLRILNTLLKIYYKIDVL